MNTLLFLDFLKFTFSDIIDIFMVGVLFYFLFRLMRGTAALHIFLGLLALYLFWKVVVIFHLTLLSEILGQFVSVGIIALIIVFQPEIRQFLLFIGSKNPFKRANFLIWKEKRGKQKVKIDRIVNACQKMSQTQTGALILIAKENKMENYISTGEIINAKTSAELIETIFFKNTPLHDGALIIIQQTMVAARCILPVSQRSDIPSDMGLRHRSAIGATETADCIAIVVSEQTGAISHCCEGKITSHVTPADLKTYLETALT
ncbi:MAG: diadenylate cyclase CdaA [Bacteroidales bacterium]|jgi:uncharacterized protein (TIGR00159 family)|nr:diadenylate cyclase CdaA [Bacteroidales bacterium]